MEKLLDYTDQSNLNNLRAFLKAFVGRNAYKSSDSLLQILSKDTSKLTLLLLTMHAHCVSLFVNFKNLMPGYFAYCIYKVNPYL